MRREPRHVCHAQLLLDKRIESKKQLLLQLVSAWHVLCQDPGMQLFPSLIGATLMTCAVGCLPCTDAGCDDALQIQFTGADQLEAGSYTLLLVTDRGEVTCTMTLGEGGVVAGDSPAANGGEGGAGGGPGPSAEVSCVETLDGLVDLNVRGGVLDSFISSEPVDSIDLTLSRDDVVVVMTTINPDYGDYYPNSKRCDETPCKEAKETVSLNSSG